MLFHASRVRIFDIELIVLLGKAVMALVGVPIPITVFFKEPIDKILQGPTVEPREFERKEFAITFYKDKVTFRLI